jgi:GNAT superfamily N-acetyltransferase
VWTLGSRDGRQPAPGTVSGRVTRGLAQVKIGSVESPRTGPTHAGVAAIRTARFEDVPAVLRVIARAVEHGCANHYDQWQRRAVVVSYGSHLFVEALERFECIVAEQSGQLVGAAQFDPADGRMRALFVDADHQGRGLGGALLTEVEARAFAKGLRRLHGAMSLNAVRFYSRHGFQRCPGPAHLTGRIQVPVVAMEKALGSATPTQ